MAKFHVIPKDDAIQHATRGGKCPCQAEVRIWKDEDGLDDTWYYHRVVSMDEAIFAITSMSEVA